MQVPFIAGFGPIVPDMTRGRAFYGDALGLPRTGMVRAHRAIPDREVSPSVAYTASVTGARTIRARGGAYALWLDHLSGGRVILGVGLGDGAERSFTHFGEVTDPKRRAEMLDE
ncbi:MAG TPA: hypothetical protein VKF37_06645, partial [Chloroflexota bacterium]|nr:hypothetical protein [Chloroflexota bacterium]